jgi:hypothetical protein
MNISQPERGGNGESKRMVNQWLPRRVADFPGQKPDSALPKDIDQQHSGVPDRCHQRDDDTGSHPMEPLTRA